MALSLREPPRAPPPRSGGWALVLIAVQVTIGIALAVWIWTVRPAPPTADDPGATRAVAGKLLAAGLVEQAASLYERVLWDADIAEGRHGKIAYGIGEAYLGRGRYEDALRWFYEAETVGGAPADTGARIVHCLERLGRVNQAQAALSSRAGLGADVAHADSDPVAARIGDTEIRAGEVLRALDALPPAYAESFEGPQGRLAFLRKYVADELLWRKATKLEIDKDPEVLRRIDDLQRQVVLDTFVERELRGLVQVDDADLQNFYTANASVYAGEPSEDGEPAAPPPLAEIRDRVERDYRLLKVRVAYDDMVREQLRAANVELVPEAIGAGE